MTGRLSSWLVHMLLADRDERLRLLERWSLLILASGSWKHLIVGSCTILYKWTKFSVLFDQCLKMAEGRQKKKWKRWTFQRLLWLRLWWIVSSLVIICLKVGLFDGFSSQQSSINLTVNVVSTKNPPYYSLIYCKRWERRSLSLLFNSMGVAFSWSFERRAYSGCILFKNGIFFFVWKRWLPFDHLYYYSALMMWNSS